MAEGRMPRARNVLLCGQVAVASRERERGCVAEELEERNGAGIGGREVCCNSELQLREERQQRRVRSVDDLERHEVDAGAVRTAVSDEARHLQDLHAQALRVQRGSGGWQALAVLARFSQQKQ
eukprot:59954-Rhodomonas_salina.1